MEDHVNNMLDLVNQLEVLGEKLADHLVVALLLCSLPDTYITLITTLESRDEKDLTLEMVKGKLINEYKRNTESEANSFVSSEPSESAMKVGKGHFKMVCHFCKKKGHLQRDCYSYKRAHNKSKIETKMEPKKAKKTMVVFNEYESETEVKCKCFMMAKPKKPESDWYIDSGTTSHMSNDLKIFEELKMGKKHPVELPDGRIIFSSGIGEGFLECINGDGHIGQILMKNVQNVPDLDTNLLSVRKLTKLGFKVNFDQNDCFICEDQTIIASGRVDENNLYKLNVKDKSYKIGSSNPSNCIHKWHRRFGHRDTDAVKKLINHVMVNGISIHVKRNPFVNAAFKAR